MLYHKKLYWLPVLAILASMTKETFLPISSSFLLGWIIYEYFYETKLDKNKFFIFFATSLVSLLTLFTIDSLLLGNIFYPWDQMTALRAEPASFSGFELFFHRVVRFLMVLGVLILLAIPHLRKLPSIILFSTSFACAANIFLGWWAGIGGAGFARGIFSAASFVICSSAAYFIHNLIKNAYLLETDS